MNELRFLGLLALLGTLDGCATVTTTERVAQPPAVEEPHYVAPPYSREDGVHVDLALAPSYGTLKVNGRIVRPHPQLVQLDPLVDAAEEVPAAWGTVCQVPCGMSVDPRATYRVIGEEFSPSKPFKLPPQTSEVKVIVRATPSALKLMSWIFFGTGVAMAGTGVAFLAVHDSAGHPLALPGGIMLGTSALFLLLGGIPLLRSGTAITLETPPRTPE